MMALALMLAGCGGSWMKPPGTSGAAAGKMTQDTAGNMAGDAAGNMDEASSGAEPGTVPGSPGTTGLPIPVYADRALDFDFQVSPEDFSLSVQVGGDVLQVSDASQVREVSKVQQDADSVRWTYPEEQISVSVKKVGNYLEVELASESEGDNSFVWPNIAGEDYYIPLGEGKRIPAGDASWQNYLNDRSFPAIEQLSMPFWASAAGDYAAVFILENPHRAELDFKADPDIRFSVYHEYPEIDREKIRRLRIYITENDPADAAKLYLDYVREKRGFVSLEQKAEDNPDIRKLYGAPFIYLWGDFIVSAADINWAEFRKSLSTGVMEYLLDLAKNQENGQELLAVVEEIKQQDYVAEYQKNVVCNYLSQLLRRDDFWDASVFTQSTAELDSLLEAGYGNLNVSDMIQVNKHALAANLPGVFVDVDRWMDADTVGLIDELKEGGIEQAWIGLNSWEQAYAKPELVERATEQGYLIASYDSYHSIHEPGKERWITAAFDDPSLYEDATVTGKDGKKLGGFQNVGRKLNPALALSAVKARMEDIMSNRLPFNSWFIDCDATGEIHDDYTPGHVTTQQEDLAARLERMSYIRDRYKLVVGSEGGNDFAAPMIAFAHGIELKSFSWMDKDMKANRESEYYIGKYYSAYGGVAEHFSKEIPVKDGYYAVFADPRYDIPLFKLVYNNSVITSYHWDWSTFKIQGAAQERMLREVLYNVPPLYHLDAVQWEKYKDSIISHQAVWGDFSRRAVTEEMTDFENLTEDGAVQKTVFGGETTVVANFGDSVYPYGSVQIPAGSALIVMDGESMVYTPS